MMLNRYLLPPKAGYVEVVENGEHVYKPTPETLARLEAEAIKASVEDDMNGLIIDHEYRLTLLELGITE